MTTPTQDDSYVLVTDVAVAVLRADKLPVAGVLRLTTPSGDSRQFALTAEQVDDLASMVTQLACDMVLVE